MSEKSAKKRTNIATKSPSPARQNAGCEGFKPRAVLTGGVYACAESPAIVKFDW